MGTCGWSDPSLVECGRFYPGHVKTARDRLHHYSSTFGSVEVDTTCVFRVVPLVNASTPCA